MNLSQMRIMRELAERGTIAFTVPHFGRYLRAQTDEPAAV